MNEIIPCDIIQDLLPLYVDGLTRETTSRELEMHLARCSRCRECFERMRRGIEEEKSLQQQEACREINYLKTLKKRNRKHVILGIAAAVLAVLGAVCVKLFFIGTPSKSYTVTYINTDQDQLHVGGTFLGSGSVYSRHKVVSQPDGSQELIIYTCLASSWNRKGVFNLTLDMRDIDKEIRINGAMVTKDGFVISSQAGRLYEAKNPYIGDASADGRLTAALSLAHHMGSFKNELQTTKEPYGWELKFEDSIRNSAVFDAGMKDYGCVLLALTGNLGEVTWVYTVETEEGPVERRRTLTTQEASDYLGEPVKSFSESKRRVQELLDLLELPELLFIP